MDYPMLFGTLAGIRIQLTCQGLWNTLRGNVAEYWRPSRYYMRMTSRSGSRPGGKSGYAIRYTPIE
jgi:hypothetical protein